MLAGGADQLYRDVLATGHRHYVRLEVWSGDGHNLSDTIPAHLQAEPEGGLAIFSGSVQATLTSRVARNLTIAVHPDLYPRVETDLLAPFGNEIRAFCGVRLGDGSTQYVWPVFRGRIRQVSNDDSGNCSIYCADRANDVLDVAFTNPENSQAGANVFAEFQRLIISAVPDAAFGVSDSYIELVPEMTWEFDRGSALDEIATSVGSMWYPLADGAFVLRHIPWTVASAPVVTLTDHSGGCLTGWSRSRSRDAIFNTVTVTGERLNGDTPVFATATDSDPTSATFVGGNFGVKSTVSRLHTPDTQGHAQTTAESLLRASISSVEDWTLQLPPDASLELGDAVRIQADGSDLIQVVSGFTLPLDLSGSMSVSTRSLVVGGA